MRNIEIYKFFATVAIAVSSGLLVPIAMSLNNKMDDYGNRLVRIEAWIGTGRQYTQGDAEKDMGVLSSVLRDMGLTLDDHERRIRVLERPVNQ